jgi:hypothetical protein
MKDSGFRAASSMKQAAGIGLFADLGSAAIQYGQANNWWKTPSLAPGAAAAPQYAPGAGGPLWKPTF